MTNLATQLDLLARVGSWDRPENTEALIRQGLESPDSAVRLTALELAAEHMDDELAAAVERLFEADPDLEVRGRAAIVLGPVLEEMNSEEDWEGPDLGELPLSMARFHEIEARLERAYRDAEVPKDVRRRALEAAVRSPRPWQKGAVRSAWASGDPDWRLTAVFCMGYVKGFEAEILEALGSDAPELKIEAVRAAGAMGLEEAGDELVLLAASDGTPRELRFAAIEALATVHPPDAGELLDSLLDSDDEEIAEAAQDAYDEMLVWSRVDGLDDDELEEDLF